MRANTSKKASLIKSVFATFALLLASSAAFADGTVNLTAIATSTTLPDGQNVPMWGYTCGDSLPASSAVPSVGATCTAMTTSASGVPQAQTGTSWQPPLITVPAGQKLIITLVNQLSFIGGANTVPTSLVIVGQLGGGLGAAPQRMPSPIHAPQGTTWPGTLGGIDTSAAAITVTNGGSGYTITSPVTIAGDGKGATAVITSVDSTGKILGIKVTNAGAGYTTASVSIAGGDGTASATLDIAALQSAGTPTFIPPAQLDRVRSFATEVNVSDAAGIALTWDNLRPGTYLIESGTEPSIQGPMGLYGVLVVTDPAGSTTAYGQTFDKDVALLLSEIDPAQNNAVTTAVNTAGFSDALVWNGQKGQCGDPAVHTCYPPAVNYNPLYYLVNGVSFDRTNPANSTQSILTSSPATATSGTVLLRLVNAGLHMHVPSVVGSKMTLLAEDGNKLPGIPKVQSEVFLAAGKTYDATVQPTQLTTPGTYDAATYPVYDRALGLSTNNQRDGGMQVYINVAGGAASGAVGSAASTAALSAGNKTYYCSAGTTLSITDPAKGLLAGATGANGVVLGTMTGDVSATTLALQSNGTFTYIPTAGTTCGGSFTFLVNGTLPETATIAECDVNSSGATGCTLAAAPVAKDVQFISNIATRYASPPPGVLGSNVTNAGGLDMTAVGTATTGITLNVDGSFVALSSAPVVSCPSGTTWPTGTTCVRFQYQAKNAQGTLSNTAHATVVFMPASNLVVNLTDAKTGVAVTDYRWIIEEDKTFYVDPKCQINSTDPALRPSTCPPLPVESLGYNFHTANMPVVAQGCVGIASCESGQMVTDTDPSSPTFGQHVAGVCDVGNGICRADSSDHKTPVDPGSVYLDPTKRYFISILPGDGINPTIGGAGAPDANGKPFNIATACGPYNGPSGAWEPAGTAAMCGHEMGGAQIAAGQTSVNIGLQQTPLPTAKISVFVFQDDNPLNGENDAGGGVDVIAPNEPGLSGFEIKLFDQAGGLGDNTGQPTYDMFNQPLTNSLAGQKDPITGLDACPITARTDRLVGMIPTCPHFESDGKTQSPLEGQAVIDNLYPGLYEIQAYPDANRIARGEEWLQTNTLDGGAPHEAFIKPNEPGYFQEFGPGNFHVAIGFANPKIINARKAGYCASAGITCDATLNMQVTNAHMSRTPDQRTYSSETYDHYSFTQCYVSVGIADAEDFAIQKCSPDGKVSFTGMPKGVYKVSVFDQWNDIMLDGLVSTVTIDNDTTPKVFPVTQWRTNLFTRTFIDSNGDGVSQDSEGGLALVNTNIRYRDGSYGFFNNTDLNGYAGFNEVFPFMNWLVVDTSATRFKSTGVHTVYDAGGPVDCSSQATSQGMPCSNIAANIANTKERVVLPNDLRVPGAFYCSGADCADAPVPLSAASAAGGGAGGSSGAVFPPQQWGTTQAWQGLLGQNTFMEFGVKPFNAGENGGIRGDVIYASTRPFDDPSLSLQLSWEPGVPRVKINLYSKTVDDSGNEKLTLVDTTTTASFDDWAQGFRRDAGGNLMQSSAGGGYITNMNCPGQDATSPFFATLKNSKQWLDTADSSGNKKAIAYNSQFKCYDGWSQLNQTQPAPYDGMYRFPSVTAIDPATGSPAGTNCTGCVLNTNASPGDWDYNKPMLPAGKYVVEVIVPPGYELVKEEDKNILLGDVYIAPVTQQFAGFGNIFIMPDQATVNAHYNNNNPGSLNLTSNLGSLTFPRHEGDTGSVETFWPCVGAERIVPDLNSLFPQAGQAAPFAGAKRRLCDRKEVTLDDQSSALAKFYVFSSTHIAGHFTGGITNDFASEFDPFSPQFGEKFGPPNLPVGMRDFNGNEVARVYSDQWGAYNGLYFSTWSVNPPNPTGYAPQMSIACMNDPGPIPDPTGAIDPTTGKVRMITDPAYNPAYSNFCYEMSFMPGFTAYMDTPVVPTMAFADNYNLPDSEYPDNTPAIKSVVNSDAAMPQGPWVLAGTTASRAIASFSVSGVARCSSTANCGNPSSITLPGGTVTCTTNGTGGPNCSSSFGSTRNNNVAAYIRNNILTLMGAGYSASGSNANVTVNAPVVGATYNGTTVVSAVNNVTSPIPAILLAGGTDATTGNMGITITALGDKVVQNPSFSGPNSTAAPYNQKTITRHYGFGTTEGMVALVGSDGVARPLTGVSWSDTTITGTVPTNLPNCAVQQRNQPATRCGELVITRGDNGKQSIDAITVTVGGSAPWLVTEQGVTAPAGKSVKDYGAAFGRMGASPIQTAIDSAVPGDLIIVSPGTYRENLIMWKPVRLQGVGAGSVTINADAHPAGKMDQWRRQVNCVFGLTLDGVPNLNNSGFTGTDPGNSAYSCPNDMHQRVDRIQFEAITGWDASGNGNLAQVLQEPTLMGAYEGAGITVLGRGVRIPANSTDFWGADPTAAGAFPTGAVYLGNNTADCRASLSETDGRDYGTGNYFCNPSRIDGVSVINSSQGGGGVFIHGWAHNLDFANTRIWGNHGTLAGGINLGNGETPSVYLNDGTICGAGVVTADTCPPIPRGTAVNAAIPFQWNTNVRVHHNMIYDNASIGDALFTGTPAGAGGITVSAGADGYQIDHNWIAGNLSTGDGGGMQQLGVSFNSRISNNYILYNQSTNPTLPTNGGGIIIEGANEPRMINGVECGATTDFDCPPGLGEGTGEGLVIDSNLILGNSAESGSGGGLRLQQINGTEVVAFPNRANQWYGVTVTNNIITNNVAGWDGGGVSLQDALKVSFVNNTVASNDTTATAGSLFKTLGAINAASPGPGCHNDPNDPAVLICPGGGGVNPHGPQPAGLVMMAHTPNLLTALAPLNLICPTSNGNGGFPYSSSANGDCRTLSKPKLINDLFWQNRSFSADITTLGTGNQSQQNLIALTPLLNQASTGDCSTAGASSIPATFYWDIGLRTDDVASGLISTANDALTITNSLYTADPQGVLTASSTNIVGGSSSPVIAQYCNGARVPPENCTTAQQGQVTQASCKGYNTPAGASETTGLAQLFVFNGIKPMATVDEGNNWLNLTYGPLTLSRPNVTTPTPAELMVASATPGTGGGAYSLPLGSSAIDKGNNSAAPHYDFFGKLRPRNQDNPADIGAVEYGSSLSFSQPTPPLFTTP